MKRLETEPSFRSLKFTLINCPRRWESFRVIPPPVLNLMPQLEHVNLDKNPFGD